MNKVIYSFFFVVLVGCLTLFCILIYQGSMTSVEADFSKEIVEEKTHIVEPNAYHVSSVGMVDNIVSAESELEENDLIEEYVVPTPKPTPKPTANPDEGVMTASKGAGSGIKSTKANKEPTYLKKVTGNGTVFTIPSGWNSAFKAYMSYRTITSVSSPQYRITRNGHTNKWGIRMYKDRYLAALGSGFTTKIGTKFDVVLTNGNVIPCILGDQKSDRDTTADHMRMAYDNSVLEFIVDYNTFLGVKDPSGTCNFVPGWKGKISKIVVYR